MLQDERLERQRKRELLAVNLWAAGLLGLAALIIGIVELAKLGLLP